MCYIYICNYLRGIGVSSFSQVTHCLKLHFQRKDVKRRKGQLIAFLKCFLCHSGTLDSAYFIEDAVL